MWVTYVFIADTAGKIFLNAFIKYTFIFHVIYIPSHQSPVCANFRLKRYCRRLLMINCVILAQNTISVSEDRAKFNFIIVKTSAMLFEINFHAEILQIQHTIISFNFFSPRIVILISSFAVLSVNSIIQFGADIPAVLARKWKPADSVYVYFEGYQVL